MVFLVELAVFSLLAGWGRFCSAPPPEPPHRVCRSTAAGPSGDHLQYRWIESAIFTGTRLPLATPGRVANALRASRHVCASRLAWRAAGQPLASAYCRFNPQPQGRRANSRCAQTRAALSVRCAAPRPWDFRASRLRQTSASRAAGVRAMVVSLRRVDFHDLFSARANCPDQ